MNRLNVCKTNPLIILPRFATEQSACFDISFQSAGKFEVSGYNQYNAPIKRQINKGQVRIMPGDRLLIPTGLIFDIPEGYSVRIHPRSGLSYKQGLVLANLEAVIDSDYVEETMILLTNLSQVDQTVTNGDRIAQAELVKKEEYVIWEINTRPTTKTDRVGGLGSTGVSAVAVYTVNGPSMDLIVDSKELASKSIPTIQLNEQAPPVKRGRGRPRKVRPVA